MLPLIEAEPVEVFGALLLNTKHEPLAWHVVPRGCLDATLVHPREAIKAACLANAAAIVVAHNHPSGDPAPIHAMNIRAMRHISDDSVALLEVGVGAACRATFQTSKLEDLVLVCSNCHRMIHRKRPWLSATELRGWICAFEAPVCGPKQVQV